MKFIPLVFIIFIVIFETHDIVGQVPEKSCRSVIQEITKLQLQLMSVCTKELKFKNGKEKSKKMNCVLRCAMIKAELVNPEGQITSDSVDYLLNKYMPQSLIEKANKTFFPCMEIGPQSNYILYLVNENFKTLEEDEFCLTYDPFVKCFLQNAQIFCN